MIVTEEVAKTKRCQESYAATSVSPTGHMVTISATSTGLIATAPSMCIGSACMAWRFLTRLDEMRLGQNEIAVYSEVDIETEVVGYCGKAGRPGAVT